ncbi:MAG: YigZ family protein [Clostridiales bacterium]|nr:YigZ family protein [Bacillota bacterium]MEE0516724.1 YigZ family protein [Anaerovoracaceae bacterium]PWL94522.1 MAG: YigZ family protein [Clostridiales bacterium]
MKLYKTVMKEACAEYIAEKSRFIAYVKPVSSKEEADCFVAEIKKKHRDATHNVPAMVIGDKMQMQWASDDGEPQGTSGPPIVKLLTSEGITDTAIVVTRYFGGIKLGTGGLVRAYTAAAKLGLEAAGICDVESKLKLICEFDYTYLDKLQNLSGEKFHIGDIRYTDKVEADILCEPEDEEDIRVIINNITSGKMEVKGKDIFSVQTCCRD